MSSSTTDIVPVATDGGTPSAATTTTTSQIMTSDSIVTKCTDAISVLNGDRSPAVAVEWSAPPKMDTATAIAYFENHKYPIRYEVDETTGKRVMNEYDRRWLTEFIAVARNPQCITEVIPRYELNQKGGIKAALYDVNNPSVQLETRKCISFVICGSSTHHLPPYFVKQRNLEKDLDANTKKLVQFQPDTTAEMAKVNVSGTIHYTAIELGLEPSKIVALAEFYKNPLTSHEDLGIQKASLAFAKIIVDIYREKGMSADDIISSIMSMKTHESISVNGPLSLSNKAVCSQVAWKRPFDNDVPEEEREAIVKENVATLKERLPELYELAKKVPGAKKKVVEGNLLLDNLEKSIYVRYPVYEKVAGKTVTTYEKRPLNIHDHEDMIEGAKKKRVFAAIKIEEYKGIKAIGTKSSLRPNIIEFAIIGDADGKIIFRDHADVEMETSTDAIDDEIEAYLEKAEKEYDDDNAKRTKEEGENENENENENESGEKSAKRTKEEE